MLVSPNLPKGSCPVQAVGTLHVPRASLSAKKQCPRALKAVSVLGVAKLAADSKRPPSTQTACNNVFQYFLQIRKQLTERATAIALGFSAALLLSTAPPVSAIPEIIRFPASPRPEIYAAQKTLLEAWRIVQQNFIDSKFGGHNWELALEEALQAAYSSADGQVAYHEILEMMTRLGDPYTRVVPPKEYADFRVSSDGEVQGVGMLIASDPNTGRLMVLSPLDGGPAARAGVRPGDEVVSIDGHSVHGWDGYKAANFLRGRSGSSVHMRLARRTAQVPGVAGRPDPPLYTEYKQVHLKREKLELSPVYSTALANDDHKVGYLRLTNFSQKAAVDLKRHISSLERNGAEAFILDLRNNPGGLVRSGLDVARIFLDGPAAIFNVSGRDGGSYVPFMQQIVLEAGQADTRRPLAVLVNHNSASASEILAGALHDNHRAAVIGEQTYGKGKIQSVFELEDGSAVFVTVARYKTPLLSEIDKVGIKPDASCKLGKQVALRMPLDPEAAVAMARDLTSDSCVLTAEEHLLASLAAPQELTWQSSTNTWSLP